LAEFYHLIFDDWNRSMATASCSRLKTIAGPVIVYLRQRLGASILETQANGLLRSAQTP
jgi:hypothetical protein